jgi:hypothetical protein
MRPLTLLALSALLACNSDNPDNPDDTGDPCTGVAGCPEDITVIGMDENGEVVTADEVYWYFAPESEEYDGEHPLECADVDCTKWVLGTAPGASFYVAGRREGPEHADPYCGYSGYDGQLVEFTGDPVTVELDLELHEWCQ